MSPRRGSEPVLPNLRFALVAVLPSGLLLGTLLAFVLPPGAAYDGTAIGLIHGLVLDTRRLGPIGVAPWLVAWLGLGVGIRDLARGRGSRGARTIGRATTVALVLCVALAGRPGLAPLSIGLVLGGAGLLFALVAGGAGARRTAGALLLAVVSSSCGYLLGDDGGPVPEPHFRPLEIRGGRLPDPPGRVLVLYVDSTGAIGHEPGEPLDRRGRPGAGIDPLRDLLEGLTHPDGGPEASPPGCLVLVPEAGVRWVHIRPVLSTAVDPDVGLRHIAFAGLGVESGNARGIDLTLPRPGNAVAFREPAGGQPAALRITLTPAAEGGVDAEAVAARTAEGPVLLAVADRVPAQVVADVIAALHARGVSVLLSPKAPETKGPEDPTGVVIER